MPLLDAALAFALTMLLVATAVTAILRVTSSAASVRRRQLKEMLREFYATELEPVVRTELIRLGGLAADAADEGILATARHLKERLVRNPDLPPLVEVHADAALEEPRGNEIDARKLVEVGTREIVERLRRTELGEQLMTELRDDAEGVFDKFAERYEAVGSMVSESFRRKSRFWSTVTAMILAFGMNIDSLFVLYTYINDDDVRAQVVAQYDTVLQQHQASASQQAPLASQAADAGDEPAPAGTELDDVRRGIEQVRRELETLQGSEFPVGWELYPYCLDGPGKDRRCPPETTAGTPETGVSKGSLLGQAPFWAWIAGCLLTGALAGLGAPFWYDLLVGIARSTKAFRSDQAPAGTAPVTA